MPYSALMLIFRGVLLCEPRETMLFCLQKLLAQRNGVFYLLFLILGRRWWVWSPSLVVKQETGGLNVPATELETGIKKASIN
jgi:hypothetical protein